MAAKRYNQQNFYIYNPVTNEQYSFLCWTTKTRNGFCHTCYCLETDTTSKASYLNRTWESYDYQSVLRKAFSKFPKEMHAEFYEWDSAKVREEHYKAEEQLEKFKQLHDGLTDGQKDALKNVTLQTQQDVDSIMSIMAMANVINELSK